MLLLIASDLHGSADALQAVLDRFAAEGAERILWLGDLLYHGPRNDLPGGYRPKEVIAGLNARRRELFCVRGNCEAEVDQMVLEFPVLADYALLPLPGGRTIFATHGHHHNTATPPPLQPGDILLHGHTHLFAAEPFAVEGGECLYLNPGSVALPKGGNPPTCMTLDTTSGDWRLIGLDGCLLRAGNLLA